MTTGAMTGKDVIDAIRRDHLKANIHRFHGTELDWGAAWIDPGGTIFGPGPYVKLPVVAGEWRGTTIRVYPPARLQRRLAKRWNGDRFPNGEPR